MTLSRVFSCDLEIPVKSQSRPLKVVPFDRLGMVSYQCSIITLSLKRTFLDIQLTKCRYPVNGIRGPSRSLKMSPFDRTHMTSYSRSIVIMGLSRTVSEVDGNFSRNRKIFPPLVLCAPSEGVPLGIGYRLWGQKTRMMGLSG